MGRYAQQRKRGGHLGLEAGLPPGPTLDDFLLEADGLAVQAHWAGPEDGPYDFWRARFRRPTISILWSDPSDDVAVTADDESLVSPYPKVIGQQQDCEIIFTDSIGNPLSQWSAYQSIIP